MARGLKRYSVADYVAAGIRAYNTGRKVYKTGKRMYDDVFGGVSTPTNKRSKGTSSVTQSGRSVVPGSTRGFRKPMSSVRPIRAFKKKTSMVKMTRGIIAPRFPKGNRRAKNYMKNFSIKGVTKSFEYNGTTTTAFQCIYLGHSTCVATPILQAVCLAMVKKLLAKAELLKPSALSGLALAGYKYKVWYRASEESTSYLPFDHTCVQGDGMQRLAELTYDWMGLNKDQPDRVLGWLELTDLNDVVQCRLELQNARIVYNIASKLKVQNRTQAAGEDANQTTTITANPLIGKTYDGYGSGTNYAWTTNALGVKSTYSFFVDRENGVIDEQPAANDLQEPPYGSAFDKVKGMNGYAIAPGAIKTSYLKMRGSKALQSIMKALKKTKDGTNNTEIRQPNLNFGNFRMIALEKLIDPVETEPNITVGFEHQFNIGVYVLEGPTHVTTNVYDQLYK